MSVLATYPRQVIVLKSTQNICGLRGRRAGLQRRMIDEGQTRGFEEYCRDLELAQKGDLRFQKRLLEHGREATSHMQRLLADASRMPQIFDDIAKSYSPQQLRLLRAQRQLTDEMLSKTFENIRGVVTAILRDHPKVQKLPRREELGYTFIFRFALGAYIWALRWIAVGGAVQAKSEKLRNDMVDISFVVYGTFFDGLLTSDTKAIELRGDILWWLGALAAYMRRR